MTKNTQLTVGAVRKKAESRTGSIIDNAIVIDTVDTNTPTVVDTMDISVDTSGEVIDTVYRNPAFTEFQNHIAGLLLKQEDIQDSVFKMYAVCVSVLNDLKNNNVAGIEVDGIKSFTIMHDALIRANIKKGSENDANLDQN